MTLEFTSCSYHENKAAVTTCYRCNRSICLEDKRTYNDGSTNRSQYHDYCIICYASKIKSNATLMIIIPIISVIIFLFVFMMLTFDGTVLVADDLIFFALFDIIFFAIFIFGYKSTKKRAFEVEQEAEQFKNSLNSSLLFTSSKGVIAEPNAEITYTKFTKPVLVCFECGGYITKQDKFCPNCGDDTKEEFQNLNPT